MDFFAFRVFIAVLGTLVAAVQDAKTSFIDDNLLYVMVAAGAILTLASFNVALIQNAFLGVVVIGVVGFFSWKAGQFGSGDVFLLLGLHLLLPEGSGVVPYPVLSIFVAASFFALIGSSLWYAVRLAQVKAKIEEWRAYLFLGVILFCVIVLYFLPLSLLQNAFLIVFVGSFAFSLLFMKTVMDFVVVKNVSLKEIEDEDVLALDQLPEKIVEKYSLSRLLTKEEVKKLKLVSLKEKIKKFPVCKELPRFGPYILAGLISYLLVGDFLVFVLFNN